MDKNVSPYFDDGVEQFNEKDYKELLFNPGFPLQARELTQLQTLSNEQLKKNLDLIYRDGAVIDGCVFSVDVAGVQCAITSGLFYHNGRIYDIDEATVAFNPVGNQKFGLEILEEIITSTEDPALNDPASGTPNYNLAGADRLKQTWSFVNMTESSHPNAIELWEVEDAVLIRETDEQDYTLIGDELARRTFDESGHYLVDGMQISLANADTVADQINWIKMMIDPGKAYVKGYEIAYGVPHFEDVAKAQTTTEYLNENHTFATGTLDYNLRELYTVEDGINAVTGQVQITNMRIDHTGGVGSSDLFDDADSANTYQNVDLGSVVIYPVDGQPATTPYVLTTDYVLSSANGGTIDWSPAGAEPVGSYYVSFQYTHAFTAPTDYIWEVHPTINNTARLSFTGTGSLPVNGSTFYVDYDHYLARTDLIQIDKNGQIVVTEGEPAHHLQSIIPDQSPEYLAIGFVKVMPNLEAAGCELYNYNYKRQTMRELFTLRSRVEDIEYNQAELALEADAKGGELPTNLKGIFVDSFESWKKVDVQHPDWKCAINNIDAELTKSIDYNVETVNFSNDALLNTERNVEGLTTFNGLLKTGETIAISQTAKSKVVNLNPYTFLQHGGTGAINPRIDTWVDTEIVNLASTNNVNVTLPTITNTSWWGWWGWGGTRTSSTTSTTLASTSIRRTQNVETQNIMRARQIPIAVQGEDWQENSRIDVYFDGKIVPCTPTGTTTDVTDGEGTHLVVKSDGTFTGTITVPAETRTGEHLIGFEDIDLDFTAGAVFLSRGLKRTITNRTITTNTFQTQRTTNIRRARVWTRRQGDGGGESGDPIAQSFIFDAGKTFSGIDCYFKSKDQAGVPAWLEIGYLVNGYPSQDTVFHRQTIPAASVTTSVNGTVATRINFTKPIHIPAEQRFFITLGSASEDWTTFTSELGGTDLATNEVITKNPYVQGVFFQSSNNNTWTAFQNLDLTCRLIEGVYEETGSVTTEAIAVPPTAVFKFEADETIPDESSITYYYSVDNGTVWNYFKPGDFIQLEALTTQLKIKMNLTGSGSVTPVIDATSYSLLTAAYNVDADNYYISRTVVGVPAYNNVRMIYDVHLPAGCSIVPQYSADGGLTWYACDTAGDVTYGVDEGFDRYEFSKDITGDGLANETSFKARILLHNSGNALVTPVVKNLKWIMKA